MSSLALKFVAGVVGLAMVVAALPADSKARKHKKATPAQSATRVQTKYWGTNLFPAGPLYNGPDYLGDDPDPFIRLQIYRDLGARYGGEN